MGEIMYTLSFYREVHRNKKSSVMLCFLRDFRQPLQPFRYLRCAIATWIRSEG